MGNVTKLKMEVQDSQGVIQNLQSKATEFYPGHFLNGLHCPNSDSQKLTKRKALNIKVSKT